MVRRWQTVKTAPWTMGLSQCLIIDNRAAFIIQTALIFGKRETGVGQFCRDSAGADIKLEFYGPATNSNLLFYNWHQISQGRFPG